MAQPAWFQQTVNDMIRRAAWDVDFWSLCRSDPARAFAEVSGRSLPEGFRLRCVPNDGADLTVVLPDPLPVGGELSEEVLDQVAGAMAPSSLYVPSFWHLSGNGVEEEPSGDTV